MLELKNVSKIYGEKAGQQVKALDGVSIKFSRTGLVFLLGKSGSGKSTLLNVAGGLDQPTSGEIVVMGKSSANFTGGDFDSYRNTYVGFVFQEYNVLSEFNVEDNIALALELQGKPKDRQKIDSILQDVNLSGYAKRKINTLSGGQKQRVAIARALVKDPQIIMADEPTGALDSSTGKQVLEILKWLSKTRLVIVVSHDREFAEQYGDRIVELKDGKIISDTSRYTIVPQSTDGNITKIDEDTISIKDGSTLSEQSLQEVKAFIQDRQGEIFLSRKYHDIKNFRRVNRIAEGGGRESFKPTDTENISVAPSGEATFIRSKLPAAKAIKIGASGLKQKKFRLILTILLSVVAFIMFGLFSTMMLYDEDAVMYKSFMNSGNAYITMEKDYQVTYSYETWGEVRSYTSKLSTRFTQDEITSLGGENAFGALDFSVSVDNIEGSEDNVYYNCRIYKAAYIPQDNKLRSSIIAGSYPVKADQICISSYFLESAMDGVVYSVESDGTIGGDAVSIDLQSVIGKKIVLSGNVYTISGVFDSGDIDSDFEELKNSTEYSNLYYRFRTYIKDGLQGCVFVSDNFAEENSELLANGSSVLKDYFDTSGYDYFITDSQNFTLSEEGVWYYCTDDFMVYDTAQNRYDLTYFNGTSGFGGSANENDIAVPLNLLVSFAEYKNGGDASPEFTAFYNAAIKIIDGEYQDDGELAELVSAVAENYASLGGEYLTVSFYEEKYDSQVGGYVYNPKGDFNIIGFYADDGEGIYCTQSFYDTLTISGTATVASTNYSQAEDAVYDYMLAPMSNLKALLNKADVLDEQTDVVYSVSNSLYGDVKSINRTVNKFLKYFLIIGLIFMFFAALLLFNFISVSIGYKTQEIGILRAIGARGIDVFKIFFSESGIIVGICLILAIIGTGVLTFVINRSLKTEFGLAISIFILGPMPILLMTAVAAAVAFIGTFLPVFLAARKKPVDSIKSL